MTDIFSVQDAARYCGQQLTSLQWQERLEAAQVLGRYDYGGQLIHETLLPGLQDPVEAVRVEVYRGLARMHFDYLDDLLDIARHIREALAMEREGSKACFAGMKALEKLSLQAEELARQKAWYCQSC